jgi:hypothetical protein
MPVVENEFVEDCDRLQKVLGQSQPKIAPAIVVPSARDREDSARLPLETASIEGGAR